MPTPSRGYLAAGLVALCWTACASEPPFQHAPDVASDPGVVPDPDVASDPGAASDPGVPSDPGIAPDPSTAPDPGPDSATCGGDDPTVGPGLPELCDGKDNDCDGETDEDYKAGGSKTYTDLDGTVGLGVDQGCGTGVCDGGTVVCSADFEALTCTTAANKSAELCNGEDDDCDGFVDDGFDVGAGCDGPDADGCANGMLECAPDGLGTFCSEEGASTASEVCDGLDNDCDGETDEDLTAPAASKTAGVCLGHVKVCGGPSGWQEPDYTQIAGYQSVESTSYCDSQDNDCDAVVDEDCPCDYLGKSKGVCDGGGAVSSSDGACLAPAGFESSETSCELLDNDCDGMTDEGCPCDYLGSAQGVCAAGTLDGSGSCSGAPSGYQASESSCDGMDNDCDGVTDEGCVLDGFVLIQPGTFLMGSPSDEPGTVGLEEQHQVTLTRAFYIETTEVTQTEWEELMGNNPSGKSPGCGTCPVENVNWWEALEYANALSTSEGLASCFTLTGCAGTAGDDLDCAGVTVNAPSGNPYACQGYRLPTEAEWEYAYRAGTTDAFYNGPITYVGTDCGGDPNADAIAWYCGDPATGSTTQPVGQKAANAWGLYDMAGNVWERCWDRYWNYPPGPVSDPLGSDVGDSRVRRGGYWNANAKWLRAAMRGAALPWHRSSETGFRMARSALSSD